MKSALLSLSAFVAVAAAHVQLQYPPARGPVVASKEAEFCDGYPNSNPSRTAFPLSGGFISVASAHPSWTMGVLLSTLENPQYFANFSQAVSFFSVASQGAFCLPVDFAAAGIDGVKDGQNVTIQIEFDGGDGILLFQCADLTLSSAAMIDKSVPCANATAGGVQTPTSTHAFPTGGAMANATSSGTPAATSSSAAFLHGPVALSGLLAVGAAIGSLF